LLPLISWLVAKASAISVKNLDLFQIELGYRFSELELLELALTHRSSGSNNNERLEFLGDSLINHVVANYIYHKFPNVSEGALSRIRAALVRRESLADLGVNLQIGEYLFLGAGECKSGGRKRKSIIADAVEAVVGAIFIDGGFETARRIILTLYSEKFFAMSEDLAEKDSKTQIQEYAQAKGLELPVYELESVSGDAHEPMYHVVCRITGSDWIGRGSGLSRQEAEQIAASSVLSCL